MLKWLVLATISGCTTGDVTERLHQREAVQLIQDLLGDTSMLPPIGWHDPECGEPVALDDGYTSKHSGFCHYGKCETGYYEPRFITAAWHGKIYRTSLPHEMLHAQLHNATGDLDKDHLRPEWYSGVLEDAASELRRLNY